MMYYGGFGWIFMVLFWVLIIGLIVLVARGAAGKGGSFGCCGGHGDGGHEKKSSALDILEKRYAKGEINKKEFESMKKDLINS